MVKITYVLSFSFLLCSAAAGQSLIPSNSTYDNSYAAIYQAYTSEIGEGARIFSGHEYANEDYLIGQNPFFLTKVYAPNPIVFDGILYDQVSLIYDIFRDQVVVTPPSAGRSFRSIALYKDRVQSFELDGKIFVRIENEPAFLNHPGDGYYQVLYQGSVQILAKRRKKVRPSSTGTYQKEFYSADEIYALQDDTFFRINSKKEARAIFNESAKELKTFAKNNGLAQESLENYFIYLARYYDKNLKQ